MALFIELYNAKHYGSSEFAEQLKPLVQWYSLKVVDLPKAEKEESVLLALVERLRTDHPSRKAAAKSCAHAAFNDPLYQQLLPRMKAELPDPLAAPGN